MIYKNAVFGVRTAYNNDYQKFSPGMILLRFLIKYLIEKTRVDYIDFQNGSENYKQKLGALHSENRYYFSCANPRSIKMKVVSLIRRFSRSVVWINWITKKTN